MSTLNMNSFIKLSFKYKSLLSILIGFYLFGFNLNVVAQTNYTIQQLEDISIRTDKKIYPTYYLKLEKKIIKTDTSFTKKLNVEWIRKIILIKDKDSLKLGIPNHNASTILITIKKKYITVVMNMLSKPTKNN